MTTSCIINFTDGQDTVSTYMHNDGQAFRAVPLLKTFLGWNQRDDLSYSIANWFYFAKCKAYDKQLGYGLEIGNYEPNYIVNVRDKSVTVGVPVDE